jgi:dipeptidyl aminopeptidase/acylaminoacyl peptidase
VLSTTNPPSGREEERRIAVVSLETGERRDLVQAGTCPRYTASGHLLYVRGGSLHAAAFDLQRLRLRHPAVPVIEDVLEWPKTSGAAYFDVSQDGTLVYVPGSPYRAARSLAWIDRRGRASPLPVPARAYAEPVLSPDGRRLAVTIEGASDDIWVYELERDTWTRVTFAGDNGAAAWSPDGRYLAFTSTRQGARNLYRVPADGSAAPERLTEAARWQNLVSYAPDGRSLLFTEQDATTLSDKWSLPLEGVRQTVQLVESPAIELFPAVSPDGRWLAYTSTESRREEVYLRSLPGPGRKWPVSREGGSQPVWSAHGRELLYRSGDVVMAVSVGGGAELELGAPQPLFTAPGDVGGVTASDTAARDGQRFLVVKGADREASPPQIVVVPDWFPELRAKLPR